MLQWVYWQAHWVWAYQWQKQDYTPEDRAFLTYKVRAMLADVLVFGVSELAGAPLHCCAYTVLPAAQVRPHCI